MLAMPAGALAQQSEYQKFMLSMSSLIKDPGSHRPRVVPPDKIVAGQLPGDGLANWPRLPQEVSLDKVRRTAANSPDGMYCAGLILQTLVKTYKDATGRVPTTQPTPSENFMNAWYMVTAASAKPNQPEHRGIAYAVEHVEGLADQRFPGEERNIATLSRQWATEHLPSQVEAIQKYDFLQMWLPRGDGTEMAHSAVYLGYAPFTLQRADAPIIRVYRIYYWSSHYQNLGAGNEAAAADAGVKLAGFFAEPLALQPGQRIGISFIDLETKIPVTASDTTAAAALTPGQLRPPNALFAYGLKLNGRPTR